MSFQVNFNTHGSDLKSAFEAVINEKDDTNWLIYAFDKGTYDLRVQGTGDGGLEELNDEFSDGKVQFAYAKVIDPNTELPKYVFIGWCGSGVPELRKAFFNSQLSDVSKFFKSFHVQINARDEADVDPKLIMKRVAESSGANYSVHKEGSKPQPRVTPVGSVYKKTEIPDIAAMQRESMTKENAPTPVGTNYKPVQTTPRKMEQRWNAAATQDSGASAVRAERERFEKEVRDREIEKAKQVSHTPPPQHDAAAARREQEEREKEAELARIRQQQEEDRRRQQQEDEENRYRQQQQEEEDRRRQQDEENRRRQQQDEDRRRQQQEEEDRRRQQQEEEEEENRRRQQQQQEEEHRKQQEAQRQREEQERKRQQQEEEDRKRQQQQEEEERRKEEEALRSQLNQTADRAVHTAGVAAAGAAVGAAVGAGAAAAASSEENGISAVVLFAYDASEANEMTLYEGEVVHQIDQVDEGWWFGVSEDGQKQGLFPANYVQILEPEEQFQAPPAPPAAPAAPVAPVAPAAPSPPPAQQPQQPSAVALYDYQAEEENEISFAEGDVITEIEFVSEDWWQGTAANGRSVGLFPANYVELKQ